MCTEVFWPDTSKLQISELSVRAVLPEAKDVQIPVNKASQRTCAERRLQWQLLLYNAGRMDNGGAIKPTV